MPKLLNADMKGYLALAWFFGTVGGALVGAMALANGVVDQPRTDAGWWLALGVSLLGAGCAAAVALFHGARTRPGRAMAVVAIGGSLALAIIGIGLPVLSGLT